MQGTRRASNNKANSAWLKLSYSTAIHTWFRAGSTCCSAKLLVPCNNNELSWRIYEQLKSTHALTFDLLVLLQFLQSVNLFQTRRPFHGTLSHKNKKTDWDRIPKSKLHCSGCIYWVTLVWSPDPGSPLNFVIKFIVLKLRHLPTFKRKPHNPSLSHFVTIHSCHRQTTTDRRTTSNRLWQ